MLARNLETNAQVETNKSFPLNNIKSAATGGTSAMTQR